MHTEKTSTTASPFKLELEPKWLLGSPSEEKRSCGARSVLAKPTSECDKLRLQLSRVTREKIQEYNSCEVTREKVQDCNSGESREER